MSNPAIRPYMTQNTGLGRFWGVRNFAGIFPIYIPIGPVWGLLLGHNIGFLQHVLALHRACSQGYVCHSWPQAPQHPPALANAGAQKQGTMMAGLSRMMETHVKSPRFTCFELHLKLPGCWQGNGTIPQPGQDDARNNCSCRWAGCRRMSGEKTYIL